MHNDSPPLKVTVVNTRFSRPDHAVFSFLSLCHSFSVFGFYFHNVLSRLPGQTSVHSRRPATGRDVWWRPEALQHTVINIKVNSAMGTCLHLCRMTYLNNCSAVICLIALRAYMLFVSPCGVTYATANDFFVFVTLLKVRNLA